MPLTVGETLTHYEILGPLGAGGMGEVYRARDTRLEREVAIKVLPDGLADDEERLRRFEREAKTLAALNHPNIAQVFGMDQVRATCFIAMELVPGEDLATRLRRGALPLDEAIDVCRQIAEGLEAAHEAGVVHRDLKPANVRITSDGVVKVLDFGLAKPMRGASSGSAATVEPGTTLETGTGVVLGTPTYMSPEQACGKPVDRRTDVWAFGCVLYECLTGERAFDGESVSEVLAAVLAREPDLSALPGGTSSSLRSLLELCFRKDPRRRMRDVGDARLLLEDARPGPPADGSPPAADARARRYRMQAAVLAAAALVLAAVALWRPFAGGRDAPAPRTTRWAIDLPAGAKLGWRGTSANLSKLGGGSPMLAISADGRRIAFCVDHGDGSEIRVQDLGTELTSRPVPGTRDGRAPFLSPRGDWLGFFANDCVQIVPVNGGGGAQPVHRVSSPNFAACWSPEGDFIVFSTNAGLWRVRPNGEDLQSLASPRRDHGEVGYSSPSVLPDGGGVLYTASTGTSSHVALLSLDTLESRTVIDEGTNAHLLPGRRFLDARAGEIRLRDFDPEAGGAAPVPKTILTDVFGTPSAGGCVVTHYAVSLDGTLVYAPGVEEPVRTTVSWVDSGGRAEEIVTEPGFLEHPRLFPDGRRFACDLLDERGVKDVYLYDLALRRLDRLTEDGTSIMCCRSPWGGVTVRSTSLQNRIRDISLPGMAVEALPTIPGDDVDTALFADCWSSSTVILTRKGDAGYSIWSYTRGDDAPVQLVGGDDDPRFGAVSPDGEWLAYTATERGRAEVFVRPLPGLAPKVKVSTEGGAEPLWSADGKALFYRRGAAMLRVTVESGNGFGAGAPVELFGEGNRYDWEPGGHRHYDLDRETGRFLMVEHHGSAPTRIHVVLNGLREADARR